MKRLMIGVAVLIALGNSVALGHGLNGHALVTDGSIEYIAEDGLKELLSDPSVLEAFRSGPIFPDSGYNPVVQRYGEAPHWEPFAQAQIAYIQDRFSPPYDLEAQRIIAFNMGSISHGLEDEIFDSLIDLNAREKGDSGEIDTGIDVFTVLDGLDRVIPQLYFPAETMKEIYNDWYGDVVPVEEMIQGMETTHLFVFEMFGDMAPAMNESNDYVGTMPWLHANYMNPRTPSSYPHEMSVVGPYMDAIWKRIHNRFTQDDLILGSVPTEGQRLISVHNESIDSWITVYFGIGVYEPTLNSGRVKLFNGEGEEIPTAIGHTRWSSGNGITRLVRIMPTEDLEYDAPYEVRIVPGLEFISGETTDREYTISFLTTCADLCDPACQGSNVGPLCGDGIVECAEVCDDGDADDCTAECNANCSGPAEPVICGDGVTECGEACDDGDQDDCTTECDANCAGPAPPVVCGDGVVECGEACDDGDHDDCTAECGADCSGPTEAAFCGDGVTECDEICDDGDTAPNAGPCNESCMGLYPTETQTESDSGSSCAVAPTAPVNLTTLPLWGAILAVLILRGRLRRKRIS